MLSSVTFAQASLATAIGVGAIGLWAGSSPPRATPDLHKTPLTGDSIRRLVRAQEKYGSLLYMPFALQALHHVSLVLTYPNIPASLLRHGGENGLDARYLTWSTATALPLAAIICIGAPLRLFSYAGLGKNFTFGLSEPDRLNTGGLYKYLQHPSYTGIAALITGMYGLWGRVDGPLKCLISPTWYPSLCVLEPVVVPCMFAVFFYGIWTRVKEEERMLHAKFGSEWETWHAQTARFIPFLF